MMPTPPQRLTFQRACECRDATEDPLHRGPGFNVTKNGDPTFTTPATIGTVAFDYYGSDTPIVLCEECGKRFRLVPERPVAPRPRIA